MNKTTMKSLIKIANDLDDLGLIKFASEIDSIMYKLSQVSSNPADAIKQEIQNTEQQMNELPLKIEDLEERIKQDESNTNSMRNMDPIFKAKIKKLKEDLANNVNAQDTYPQTTQNYQIPPSNSVYPMMPTTIT